MSNFFSSIDMYGTLVQFTIDRHISYKTNFGGILTLTSLASIFFFSFIFGANFYFKINPTVLSTSIKSADYATIPYTYKNVFIAFRIENNNQAYTEFDDKIYPLFEYFEYKMNNSTKMQDLVKREVLPYRRCNEIYEKPKEFENYSADKWYCIDLDSNIKRYLGGYWDADFVKYFRVQIFTCKPDSEECTDKTVMKSWLADPKYISFLYPYPFYDAEDISTPMKVVYRNYFTQLGLSIVKTDRTYFSNNTSLYDAGWLFDDINIDSRIAFSYMNSDYSGIDVTDSANMENKYIYKNVFYFNPDITKNTKSYMKLQDMFARLGGLILAVIFIFRTINYPFNMFKRNNYLFNELFEFKPSMYNYLI
jgi:hypothetical protein